MSKVALFLNGQQPQSLPDLNHYDTLYCTDGAYDFLASQGITPDVLSGDFDSILNLPKHIRTIHTPDQNFTDFDKALKIIETDGHTHIDVFAASGLEQDHFLGNLSTASKYRNKLHLVFYDDHQSYYFLKKNTSIKNIKGKMISLMPFPKASKINSSGLKYPLKNMKMSLKKHSIGTRNFAINDEIHLSFEKGRLLIFIALNATKPNKHLHT